MLYCMYSISCMGVVSNTVVLLPSDFVIQPRRMKVQGKVSSDLGKKEPITSKESLAAYLVISSQNTIIFGSKPKKLNCIGQVKI